MAVALKKSEEQKKKALADLEASKNKEMATKIKKTEETERKKADETLQQTKKQYEAEISKLKVDLKEKQAEITKLVRNIQALEVAKSNVEANLLELHSEYQNFVNRVQPFEAGMSDYLIKPVYIDEIGKVPDH